MSHILERFFIHFAASTFATLAFFFALRFAERRLTKLTAWLPTTKERQLVFAALCVFAILPLREPLDVAAGQVWYKAITDQISWFIGPIVSVWGLHRYDKI